MAVFTTDADAFIVLDPGAGAFGYFIADTDGVSGFEIGNIVPEGGDLFRL